MKHCIGETSNILTVIALKTVVPRFKKIWREGECKIHIQTHAQTHTQPINHKNIRIKSGSKSNILNFVEFMSNLFRS